MSNNKRYPLPISFIMLALLLAPHLAVAHEQDNEHATDSAVTKEAYNTGWQFYFDNDISFSDEKDRNYTGGVALTLTGKRATEYWFSLDNWLNGMDRAIGFQKEEEKDAIERHAIEFGLTIFTPDDIVEADAIEDDHPYANMLFLSNSQSRTYLQRGIIFQSTLLIGLLGSSVGEEVQKAMHNLTGSDQPRGWHNQISNGGELTAKYSVAAQKILLSHQGDVSFDIRGGVEAGIGYSTDINGSISFRLGKLETPWWSFTPHQSEYISIGQTFGEAASNSTNQPELFLWGGLNLKYRLYNAILQGQFRGSAVTFDRDELEPVILNVWLGATKTFSNGLGISFVMRKQNNEIEGSNRDDPFWSDLIISKTY
ncbi:MAG: lipid A deacylase LpxR family protein [Candidatus Thiodiazotropha sp. (ex Ctena orbiculata)]|nr:lipid A deacylase LpxR family protein [Candidatus Thiodiazotropha taylori]MBT3034304.1 lipid A deacylase LpxR family protein [Candidatus Thiodiazotropha taylori]